jgi:hypothetical protein
MAPTARHDAEMARFYLLSFLLLLALTAVAMISCLSAEPGEIRGLPRGLWVVLILLVPLVGPALYFVFGRPQRDERSGLDVGLAPPPKGRPLPPDDDPEFLARLGRGRPAHGPQPPRSSPPTKDAPDDTRSRDDSRSGDDTRTKDDTPPTDG